MSESEKEIKILLEALRFIEYGCEEIIDEYEIDPSLRDIIDEFRVYAKVRNEYPTNKEKQA